MLANHTIDKKVRQTLHCIQFTRVILASGDNRSEVLVFHACAYMPSSIFNPKYHLDHTDCSLSLLKDWQGS